MRSKKCVRDVKTTACMKIPPFAMVRVCAFEPGALCCGMFLSVHNCQNVIPLTQRSSKPVRSILKTI